MVCRFRGTFMVRSLTFAVALALGTVSIPAYALGLGDIKTTSALNQEFKAEIALLSVAKGELDGVQVKLAGADEFEKAGIERPFYLTLLKFKPERLPDGRAVIRVTSDFPIREPFLDFLVEINWPKGRLIREYTVLLDPPVTTKRRAPQVQTAPARVATSRAAATPRGLASPVIAGKGEYGPVNANETLWSIARKLRPSGASMEQMMIALHRANLDAFIGGDINRLKRGQVLRVPSADEVLSLPRAEARQAYRQAQAQWLAQRSQRMQQAAGRKATTGQGAAGITTPVDEPQSELRIATARPEGKGEAGASEIRGDETIDEIKRKLLLARENAEASRLESEALRNEVDELQKRLDDMRRLLMLKDEQLARLQVQTRERMDAGAEDQTAEFQQAPMQEASTGETAGDAVMEGAEQVSSEQPSVIAADLIAAADAVVEENNAREGVPQAMVQPGPAATSTGAAGETRREEAAESTGGMAASSAETVESAQSPTGAAVPQVEVPPVADDADIFTLLRDNLPIVAGGGGILVLLLILLGIRRKRAEVEEGEAFDDLVASSLDEETSADISSDSAAVDTKEKEGEVDEDSLFGQEETSFLSEFTPSDMNALRDETGEVDPISEADVYIAYGRYQQVEDLLKQALTRDPDRLALKHKLLEVYYATRNAVAFNELAESMVENGQDIVDPDAWSRICDMGREIAPDNRLYQNDTSSQVTSEVFAGGDYAESAARIEEGGAELASQDDTDGKEAGLPGLVDEPSLDLDDFKELEDLGDLDTRPLDSLDLDLSSVENVAEADRPDDAIDLPALDIVAGEGGVEESRGDDEGLAQLEELSDLAELEDDLNRLTEELASDLNTSPAQRGLDEPLSIDEAFDKAVDEEIEISSLAPETVDAEAVDTKLDLARAFLEMGDAEGAKDILEEIRQEGNEIQRKEAEKLLADIS